MSNLHMLPAWMDKDPANDRPGTYLQADNFARIYPMQNAQYKQFIQPSTARKGFILKAETAIKLILGTRHAVFECRADTPLNATELLDVDQALLPARDYYIYACYDAEDALNPGVRLVVSLNATYPDGFDEQTSRKIGGFHTLCASVGAITGHPLSGFEAGDILPASLWCLTHRPETCGPEGMVYVKELGLWVDIYLQSGKGAATRSAYGATITDTQPWMEHVDDLAAVGKTLLTDTEFSVAALGSNEKTNIGGSADPVTTGGHVDTAGRRMISRYGLEDCCGALWQWLDCPTANGGSAWSDLPGNKGAIYGVSNALLAGGHWVDTTRCGSRARATNDSRASASASVGGRGRARSL